MIEDPDRHSDAGPVQTNYSLKFSQQPTDGHTTVPITPPPTVQLYENGGGRRGK